MPDADIITPELAGRLERLLDELRATPCSGQEAGCAARQHGIAIVDAKRERFLVDETVYQGALYRSALYRKRNDQLEAWAAHIMPATGVWRRLSDGARET